MALRKALRAEEKERGRRRIKGKKSNPRVDQGDSSIQIILLQKLQLLFKQTAQGLSLGQSMQIF